jgi:hypothetical protein
MLPHEMAYQPGDIVFFDWSEDGEIDHVAVVSEIRPGGRPLKMYDATGVIASNPGGLAAELPWEAFHERTVRGHARWSGKYEPISQDLPVGQYVQLALGSSELDIRLLDQDGNALSRTDDEITGGRFGDWVWEQTISVAEEFSGNEYFLAVIVNPAEAEIPYQFIAQFIEDGYVTERVEFKDVLASKRINRIPLMLTQAGENIRLELGNANRRIEGKIQR